MLQTMIEQNYSQVFQEYCKQTDGLAMGAPTSSVLVETYIQPMKHKQIYPILIKQQIIAYLVYIDDILMIYDQNKTNIEQALKKFNKLQPSIKFMIEKELHKSECIVKAEICDYQYTDNPHKKDMLPNSSCHPNEHKLSGINYLIN
jgi:hypothetical protein